MSLSYAEMVLVTIYRISNGAADRVAFEDIVIRAWNDFPDHFSLRNHLEYPDAAVVSKRLYGDLITKRLVVSLKNQQYKLSQKGLTEARHLETSDKHQGTSSPVLRTLLDRDEEQFIKHALHSRTFATWKEEKGNDLIDYDARVFFQFSTGTPVRERQRKVDTAKESIEKAKRFDLPEAESLSNLFNFLMERFKHLFQEV